MSKTYKDGKPVLAVVKGCVIPARKTSERGKTTYHGRNGIRWTISDPKPAA